MSSSLAFGVVILLWTVAATPMASNSEVSRAEPTAVPTAEATARRMVLTFDDLPANSTQNDLSVHAEITDGILTALQTLPAYGFVNESKLYRDEELEPRRVALLQQWLTAGHELGNHTFSHPDLHSTPLNEYQQDLLKGEVITRPLAAAADRPLRYFRHPFLHTGRDLETQRALGEFLTQHGYRIAPVTIDNSEWIFARAYDRALDDDKTELAERIGAAYDRYMIEIVAYYEQQSTAIVGYELPQILLLHANRLNAHRLPQMLTALIDRGYRFVTLDNALADPAYTHADTYTGPAGITWLHRWALTDGKRGEFFAGEPGVPEFVSAASGVE